MYFVLICFSEVYCIYFQSDSNSSAGYEKVGIDAYLHPSMLQDPWVPLRKWLEENKKS